MNKTQLIDVIAEKADLTKAQAKLALEETLAGITNALKDGEQVQLISEGNALHGKLRCVASMANMA